MAENISTLHINAPAEKVWDTITNPAKVKLWQFGSDLITTWQAGTPIEFATEWEGTVFKQWGNVIEFHPYELVKYSLFAPRPGLKDVPENYFTMHYILTPGNGGTTLKIIQEDNRPGAVQEPPQGEENPVLKLLKEVAEAS